MYSHPPLAAAGTVQKYKEKSEPPSDSDFSLQNDVTARLKVNRYTAFITMVYGLYTDGIQYLYRWYTAHIPT